MTETVVSSHVKTASNLITLSMRVYTHSNLKYNTLLLILTPKELNSNSRLFQKTFENETPYTLLAFI